MRILVPALCLCAGAAAAAPVAPVSYDMINGGTGSWSYRDESYDGSGNPAVSYAALSGGTGDLTDGVVATQNWNASGQTTSLPYVGWQRFDPTITFRFARSYVFDSFTISFDDSKAGGVTAPSQVNVGALTFAVADPAGTAPFSQTFVFGTPLETDEIAIQILRGGEWTFVSEVQFEAVASVVPVPAGLPLLALGLGGLALLRRRA